MSSDIPFILNMADIRIEKKNKPELLAPAGDYGCFLAALNAGADAVYLALSDFGARAYAKNFSRDELKEALEISHILKKKIYLTVNTLLKDKEFERLYDILEEPYRYGLAAVIVQDAGVMSYIHRNFPLLPIHVSTQAAVTSSDGCEIYKSLGVTRIVPARELSLNEIKKLADETQLEIECFIHGSMCYSYSGKCLLSSFIGGRSGNRGRCAGPCRLMYDGAYPLSLKDMCTIDMIGELAEAGISSFKIEGRMKSREYVYGVTSIYRKYIDRFWNEGRTDVDASDRRDLISYYTRSGNCSGYYHVHNNRNMITPDSPAYETQSDVFEKKDIEKLPAAPVFMECLMRKGEPVKIKASCRDIHVETVTDTVCETATGKGLSADDVKDQLRKSGGTAFFVDDIKVDLEDGLFLPKSSLNAIRRLALDSLKEKIVSAYKRPLSPLTDEDHTACGQTYDANDYPEVNVYISDPEQLAEVLNSRADGIIIPLYLLKKAAKILEKPCDKKLYICLPFIIREEGMDNCREKITENIRSFIKDHDVEGFYVSNTEGLSILCKESFKKNITGGIHIYVTNRESYRFFRNTGIDKTTVPVELNRHELINREIKGEELLIYGRIPVMISANCIYNTKNGCKKSEDGHVLNITDRKQADMFVRCICSECTNVLYNSEVLSIADEDELFDRIRPSSVRFSFTNETASETAGILNTYFEGRRKNGSSVKPVDRYTKGHLNRGID